jgi:hypothetical protein
MVHAGAPTVTVAVKESTALAAGPVGFLMAAVTKGGLTEGCRDMAVVAPTAVPVGAPAATMAPTMCSREAAVTA